MAYSQSAYKGSSGYLNGGVSEAEAIHSSGQRYVEEKNWPHGVRVVVGFVIGLLSCPDVVSFGYLYPASCSRETITVLLEHEYRNSVAEKTKPV